MLVSPSVYTIGNWLTMGSFDTVKGAVAPEKPLSLQHWVDSAATALMILPVLRGASKLVSKTVTNILKYQYTISCLSSTEDISVKVTGIQDETWQDMNQKIVIESEGVYEVKIRAVSNAGNTAEVAKYTIINDFTLSTAQLLLVGKTLSIEAWDEISGVDTITLPDGSVVSADKAVFPISENGTYTFTVADKAGNEYSCSYDVTTASSSSDTAFYKNPVVIEVSLSLLFLILILIIVLIIRHREDRGYY